MLTTKQLAAKLGVSNQTALDAGERARWDSKDNPYAQGLLWDVTDEQIEDYKQARMKRPKTAEERRNDLERVFELLDANLRGVRYPRGLQHNLWNKRPSMVRTEDCSLTDEEEKHTVKRGRGTHNKSTVYYRLAGGIKSLLLDGYYSPTAIITRIVEIQPDAAAVSERTLYRYIYQLAEELEIEVRQSKERQGVPDSLNALYVKQVKELHKRGLDVAGIVQRLLLSRNDIEIIIKRLTHDSITV